MTLEYESLLFKPFTGIGRDDCFALFRQFYKQNFGIEIRNYARPHDWDSNTLDLIRLCHEAEGFDIITDWKIKDLRPGDGLAIMVGSSNPDHLSVYLGEGKMLHHLYGQFSREEEFQGFWRNHTAFILRHPDVPDLRPVYPDVQIGDILSERNSPPG